MPNSNNFKHIKAQFHFETLYRPKLKGLEKERLVSGFRRLALSSLGEIPEYQVLTGEDKILNNSVIAIAYDSQGQMLGFCSSLLLDVAKVGEVLHLGLTCVSPLARGNGLTHRLTGKVLQNVILRRPFSKVWVSNVACVLSSLGNVAKHFENIYPSPFYSGQPTQTHLQIAKTIDRSYRKEIYISEDAKLDEENFVFRGSVSNTAFEKLETETQYFHRNPLLNQYYQQLLNLSAGDEAVQVGSCSLFGFAIYRLKRLLGLRKKVNPPLLTRTPC